MKVYNSDTILAERALNAGKIRTVTAFRGNRFANLEDMSGSLVHRFEFDDKALAVVNADEMARLRYRIVNARKQGETVQNSADAPSTAALEAFFGRFFLDVTRRTEEAPDLTNLIAEEMTNLNFPKLVYLRDILRYRGEMGTVSGQNDAVPMIQQHEGNTNTLALEIKAVGWKDNLENMLYNMFFSMDKVVQAAVDADVDARNAAIIGAIVAATFVASQKQGAITTADQTLDQHTYDTLLAGVKLLRGLKDPQTLRKIAVSRISLLCNSADTWQIENVIRGQLNANGGGATGMNKPSLPISNIVEYDRGINDGIVLGKKTLAFPGVTAGKCYLFVPGVAKVANKRPLTMESGRGSVLELSTEERAWYRVQGTYLYDFLGSSYAGFSLGASYGAIVEVTLPTT
jgi:hypothetical protein